MSSRLLVKGFPSEFSDIDKTQFLMLFGGKEIICMSKFGRMKNACFVSFDNDALAKQALEALHQCDVLGQLLVAEFAKPQHNKTANRLQSKLILDGIEKEDDNKSLQIKDEEREEEMHGISPNLGVYHEFPKHLKYKYPDPNITILTNMANALATVPKFYTQVLHLMNKLNLPPPFSGPTLTPPLQGDSVNMHDACVDTADLNLFVTSSDESEIETDSEFTKKHEIYKGNQLISGPIRKRKRLKALHLTEQGKLNVIKSKPAKPLESTFELSSSSKRFEFKLASSIQEVIDGKKQPQVSYNVFDERGEFGKIQPLQKDVESEESSDADEIGIENSFILSKSLKENRISNDEILSMTQFKNYTCGEKTNRLYIKNIAKTVQDTDLIFIFNRFVSQCSEAEKELMNVRLMQEGRMKGQAFVTFPSEKIAEKALKSTHGYILHDKPMVVQFARSAKAKD